MKSDDEIERQSQSSERNSLEDEIEKDLQSFENNLNDESYEYNLDDNTEEDSESSENNSDLEVEEESSKPLQKEVDNVSSWIIMNFQNILVSKIIIINIYLTCHKITMSDCIF